MTRYVLHRRLGGSPFREPSLISESYCSCPSAPERGSPDGDFEARHAFVNAPIRLSNKPPVNLRPGAKKPGKREGTPTQDSRQGSDTGFVCGHRSRPQVG